MKAGVSHNRGSVSGQALPDTSRILVQVGLEDWQLCMLLLRYPRIVEYPLDHLRARLQYFTHLGLTRAQLEQVSCPVSSLRRLSYAWQRQALHYENSHPCLHVISQSICKLHHIAHLLATDEQPGKPNSVMHCCEPCIGCCRIDCVP